MKNKKKIILIISIILVIISILGLLVYNFYKGYKEDKRKTEETIKNINSNYDNFIVGLNELNLIREKVYSEIFKETYYTDMQNNIDNWNSILNEYSKTVKNLDNNSNFLKENCNNLKFYNSELNQKCTLFIDNYEIMINYYMSDIKAHNDNIDSYNTWVLENTDKSYKIIDKFVNNYYTEYVDYNNDRVF